MASFGVCSGSKAGFQQVSGIAQASGRPVMAELINIPSTKLLYTTQMMTGVRAEQG